MTIYDIINKLLVYKWLLKTFILDALYLFNYTMILISPDKKIFILLYEKYTLQFVVNLHLSNTISEVKLNKQATDWRVNIKSWLVEYQTSEGLLCSKQANKYFILQ